MTQQMAGLTASNRSNHSHPPKQDRQRFHILDLLRAVLLLQMMMYHALYDWVFLFDRPCSFLEQQSAFWWQQSICSGFILLAGCCCTMSRRPARRGGIILGSALVLSAVTILVMPSEQILFGILHFTGSAYLLTALLRPVYAKLPLGFGAVMFFALFALTRGIYYGYLGLFTWELWPLPDWCFQGPEWLFVLGLPAPGFYSADYFPLVPWYFLFLAGYLAGPLLLRSRWFQSICHWQLPFLNWIGRHTLPLYLAHQPVIYGLLLLLCR